MTREMERVMNQRICAWLLGFTIAYFGSYVILRTQATARADAHDIEGYYFVSPNAGWQQVHLCLSVVYWPLWQIESWIWPGKVPACSPLDDLS